ncbi:integrase core domain-containing protein [Klebsiella pneumoniae]
MERFWRTLKEDLIAEADFDSMEEFRDELMQYMLHYNQQRPHQRIMGNSS